MARVTVEDCVLKVPNRFELVLLSGQRAREIASGAPLTVDRDNDKNSVVSLREIADETVLLSDLSEALIKSHQKIIEIEEDEEDVIDYMEGEQEWSAVAETESAPEKALEGDDVHVETKEEMASAEAEITE